MKNSDFVGAGEWGSISEPLACLAGWRVSVPLHYGGGVANPKNLLPVYRRAVWRYEIDPGNMHHRRGFE